MFVVLRKHLDRGVLSQASKKYIKSGSVQMASIFAATIRFLNLIVIVVYFLTGVVRYGGLN